MKHIQLITGAVGISNDKPWANNVESCVNVHWVRVLEAEQMYLIAVSKMAPHPLNPKLIGHLGEKMQAVQEIGAVEPL